GTTPSSWAEKPSGRLRRPPGKRRARKTLRGSGTGCAFRVSSSTLDLPATVGLAARCAVPFFLLVVDRHGRLVFAAVLTVRLVRADGRPRPGVAAIRFVPCNRLPRRSAFHRFLSSFCLHPLVPLVQHVADETAQERAADHRAGDRRAASARRRSDEPTERRAAHTSDRGFRILLDRGAPGRRNDDEQDNGDALNDPSWHALLLGRTARVTTCSKPPNCSPRGVRHQHAGTCSILRRRWRPLIARRNLD